MISTSTYIQYSIRYWYDSSVSGPIGRERRKSSEDMLSNGTGKPQAGDAPERKRQNPNIVQLKGSVFAFLESPCVSKVTLRTSKGMQNSIFSSSIAVVFDSHFRIFDFFDRWLAMVWHSSVRIAGNHSTNARKKKKKIAHKRQRAPFFFSSQNNNNNNNSRRQRKYTYSNDGFKRLQRSSIGSRICA